MGTFMEMTQDMNKKMIENLKLKTIEMCLKFNPSWQENQKISYVK